jgi:uncharacterized protein YneF (UPF0154 family)
MGFLVVLAFVVGVIVGVVWVFHMAMKELGK